MLSHDVSLTSPTLPCPSHLLVCCRPRPLPRVVCLQVRAEHRAEHDLFRAILLGHSSTPAGPSSAHKAPGSGGTGASGSQSRMFMQQRQSL